MHPSIDILRTCMAARGRSGYATVCFQYGWTVRDGTLIPFKVMDLFTFEPGTHQITGLDLIHDTHPIRLSAGNTYAL